MCNNSVNLTNLGCACMVVVRLRLTVEVPLRTSYLSHSQVNKTKLVSYRCLFPAFYHRFAHNAPMTEGKLAIYVNHVSPTGLLWGTDESIIDAITWQLHSSLQFSAVSNQLVCCV